ncbi:MAG: DUF839 domain-containing protein [Rhodocyclaceae bacterium]|nr:DUF839 domain-containing protein [Rhodocyclaceae bacterium]
MSLSRMFAAIAAACCATSAGAVPPLARGTALEASKEPVSIGTEMSRPFDLPPGYKQVKIIDRDTLTAQGLPATFGNWDMVSFSAPENSAPGAYPDAGLSIFIPAEVGNGAGVFRYDVASGRFVTLMQGIGGGNGARNPDPASFDPLDDEFTRLDPATYTPFDTVVTGEETTGGRLFEITNPFADNAADAGVRWLDKVPAISHEGVRFDAAGTMYVVDENNSGSLYKYVPSTPGDLAVGQTFVLAVDAFAGNPAENWDSAANAATPRSGAARWVPLTDADGHALTNVDPFIFADAGLGTVPTGTAGRAAADEMGATPYGRPEDVVIGTRNGEEILYFTATSEDAVYAVRLQGEVAWVSVFADRSTLDVATGEAVGTPFNNPDNLAIDADGHIYIVEDQEPAAADVWQAIDEDGDGVAERMGRWLTHGAPGAEPTGLSFDPNVPMRAIISIQHPASGNDALWQVTLGQRKGQLK